MRRLFIVICLLSATLLCNATITLPDSMLTIKSAYNVTNSDTSLAIIQTMRQRQLAEKWQLDMAEADYCYATMDYTKAVRLYQAVYDSGEAKSDATIYLALLARLMQTHDIMYDENELVTYMVELKDAARRYKNDAYLAMADFTLGKRKHYHRKKQEGLEMCAKAVEVMKASDYFRKYNELCSNYTDLLQMYAEDGRYDDAMRMSLLQEEAALRIKGVSANNKETLRYVYGMRASLLAKAGRKEEADRAYDEWKKQDGGNAVVDRPILDYLIIYKHYEQARDIIHDYCNLLRNQKDNYSYRMITMLTTAAQVETALGDTSAVARHSREIKAIADSLHIDKSYSMMQKSWDLIRTEKDVKLKNSLVSILGLLLLFSTAIGLIILYYSRRLRRRNEKLVKALNSVEAYRNMAMGAMESSSEEPTNVETTGSPESAKETAEASETIVDENERLFVKLDGQITRNRLFLNPNFGRDDMARLIGVDKNRIGHIMSRYSDASNASVYINTKRVEYGAKLLLEHPEYTIAAIANECGMTNTVTFNRTFKEVYGMTPSEYRTKPQKNQKGLKWCGE